jgi:hypothetical protein
MLWDSRINDEVSDNEWTEDLDTNDDEIVELIEPRPSASQCEQLNDGQIHQLDCLHSSLAAGVE